MGVLVIAAAAAAAGQRQQVQRSISRLADMWTDRISSPSFLFISVFAHMYLRKYVQIHFWRVQRRLSRLGEEWTDGISSPSHFLTRSPPLSSNLATARPGCEAALPLRDDSTETETASIPSFVIAGSNIL